MSDAFVGHDDAAFGQLHVSQAEAEQVIQPDGMADDLGRKPMPRIRGGFECHVASLAHLILKRQRRLTWQCRHRGSYETRLREMIDAKLKGEGIDPANRWNRIGPTSSISWRP
jgi:hypothetical protein